MPAKRRLEADHQRRRGKRNKRHNHQPASQEGKRGAGYEPIIKENTRFEAYYQAQGVVPAAEWDQFMATLRQSLPSTFRITGTRRMAEAVRECLQRRFFTELAQIRVEGQPLTPPTPLPWYPNNLAWYVPLSRAFIRSSPFISKFHRFLVDESDQGNISRQEAVSMIPPWLMDVLPHHKVLDMCAAPGSKTAQLIEMIHAEEDSASLPAGVVVANDADNKRCYMLVHQAKRLNSPCFMVTNHDASVFPVLYYHDENDVRLPLHYDRVLCDVPCSGDGTIRKNPTIWRSWNPSLGPSLHKLQLRILHRGLELLAPGGRLVYSTCSLNPVENEAVIATALHLCKGSVELVDVSDKLPGLKTVSGMLSWKVMSKKGECIPSAEDIPKNSAQLIALSMFPPDPTVEPQLNLQRCIRILPHHQDTGGFFIAVLHKSDWLPWQRRSRLPQQKHGGSNESPPTPPCRDEETEERVNDGGRGEGREGREGIEGLQEEMEEEEKEGKERVENIEGSRMESWEGGKQKVEGGREEEGEGREEENRDGMGERDGKGEEGKEMAKEPQQESEQEQEGGADVAAVGEEMGAHGISQCGGGTGSVVEDVSQGELDVEERGSGMEGAEQGESEGGEKEGGDIGEGVMVEEQVEGNFIAAKDDLPVAASVESCPTSQHGSNIRPPASVLGKPSFIQRQAKRGRVYREDPYVFLKKDSDIYQLIKPHYGLPASFPSSQLLTRSVAGKKRNLYLASGLVKEILQRNELHIKIINAGVKILARCNHPNATCAFRLCQEGLETLVPFIMSSCVLLTLQDLVVVLEEPNPHTSQLARATQDALSLLGIGPALFKYIPDQTAKEDDGSFRCPIYLSGWVARKSVRLYADKKYRCHFLAMLGRDPPANMTLASVSGKGKEKEEEEDLLEMEEEGKGEGEEEQGGVEKLEGGAVEEEGMGRKSDEGREGERVYKGEDTGQGEEAEEEEIIDEEQI